MYKIPDEFYFRLHHVRPRFKNNIEDVLIFVANEISELPKTNSEEFAVKVNEALRGFPGNVVKTEKTINNWRTEISALFGFIESDDEKSWPGARAKDLANNQDLIECFKIFLYSFQYPGAHIKPHEVKKLIEKRIRFKPAQYILKVLKDREKDIGSRDYLTKAEVCHCIFNDLRCTRDNEPSKNVWARIDTNRQQKIEYDRTGDVIRYAGDIVDYMEIANLLETHDGKKYYTNPNENESILKFINSEEWFIEYDEYIKKGHASLTTITKIKNQWFEYVNRDLELTDFSTDISKFIPETTPIAEEIIKGQTLVDKLFESEEMPTQDVGNMGESLIFGHECQRVKIGGRKDLIHLIKRIPTYLATGYDIQSVELNELKRYIEVKTTISSKPLMFNKIHLTTNEWAVAQTLNDRYFIYRLMISKFGRKLFVIQNPVDKYKNGKINMLPKNGADITFNDKESGSYEELLVWKE